MKKWREALNLSRQLCGAAPDSGAGFVHSSFCLHELGRTAEAKRTLLAGAAALENEPVFFYNLACYECALGNLGAAREHLERSIEMDKKYREFAETDPDLAPLREKNSRG
jgi:tetratricopeptide (TPR) repeat protein